MHLRPRHPLDGRIKDYGPLIKLPTEEPMEQFGIFIQTLPNINLVVLLKELAIAKKATLITEST